jgi:hypothetical protein
MIRIASQGGTNQYDESGRAITTWDAKKCSWIVNEEFENEEIDWWGEDNDFARGCTLSEFIENNPNWDKNPDIVVTWMWNTKESYQRFGGSPASFGGERDYYDKLTYPFSVTRSWGYLDYSEDEAIKLASYCDFDKLSDSVKVVYNGETLLEK